MSQFATMAESLQCGLLGHDRASAVSSCDAQGAWVTEKLLRPRPVTADLFAERIEGVDAAMGAAIVRALASEGMLNATGFLLEDPRSHLLTLQTRDLVH